MGSPEPIILTAGQRAILREYGDSLVELALEALKDAEADRDRLAARLAEVEAAGRVDQRDALQAQLRACQERLAGCERLLAVEVGQRNDQWAKRKAAEAERDRALQVERATLDVLRSLK